MSASDRSDYTIAAASRGPVAPGDGTTRSGRNSGYPDPVRTSDGIAGDGQARGELALRRLVRLLARIAVAEVMAEGSPERADGGPSA